MTDPNTTPTPSTDDIQTEDDARAYFEALGVPIVDDITVIS